VNGQVLEWAARGGVCATVPGGAQEMCDVVLRDMVQWGNIGSRCVWLDWMVPVVFSNFGESVILFYDSWV